MDVTIPPVEPTNKVELSLEGKGVVLTIEADSQERLDICQPLINAVMRHIEWIQRTGTPLPDFELMAIALDEAAGDLAMIASLSKREVLTNVRSAASETMERSTPEQVSRIVDRITGFFQFKGDTDGSH